ncbi:alpha/beta hydrolase [Planosporangium thailandense]|uniref:Alpha/beta hydrolase n=1 Tax=Planosporangium thailandense TaxID=765197 RepID=A0ABX0XYM4_9ACTN|nr:alpha/beta family hydrolase [Planosporangium thailandense]NJC70931.1 alpha/beta hydrolase [Planosporangium thailandense]
MIEVATAYGPARLDIDHPASGPSALLVLGHGAGGGVDAVDLVAVRAAAVAAGLTVARLTQPYRVAGRRAPAPASQLDRAYVTAVSALRDLVPPGLPLIVGGRSSGARVACRTADELGAVAVLALAFPLHPPGKPDRSRAGELPTGLPTLVLNGDRDPFGVPPATGAVEVRVLPGETHDLRRDPAAVAALAVAWLADHGWTAG